MAQIDYVFPLLFLVFSGITGTLNTKRNRSWSGQNASSALKMLLASDSYDKRLRPNFEGPPVRVKISMFVTSIGALDEKQMQFQNTFFLRQDWDEPRLAFGRFYNKRNLTLSGNIIEQIWKPDTYITNEKSVMAPRTEFLLKITPQGRIVYSQRVTVVAGCKMELQYFPMDRQHCSIDLESYGMSNEDLTLEWDRRGIDKDMKNAVSISEDVVMSQFAIDGYELAEETATYPTGAFTLLRLTYHVRRKKFYYVVQTYIPTILITVLSWVSFWIPRNSPPARVGLGITTVLALTTLIFGIQSSMPKVSYVKAIDWFLCISFLYVFAALVEYPGSRFIEFQASKLSRRGTFILKKVQGRKDKLEDFPLSNSVYGSMIAPEEEHDDLRRSSKRVNEEPKGTTQESRQKFNSESLERNPDENDENIVDKYARILFPLTYFLYNLGYWIVYLSI